jgi:hypothetical protein
MDSFGEHGVTFLTRSLKERELFEMGVSTGAPLGNVGKVYIYGEI